MKRTTLVLAYMTYLCLSHSYAALSTEASIEPIKKTYSETSTAKEIEKKSLELIPNVELELTVNYEKMKLEVKASGFEHVSRDWIIFQAKGKPLSKISTTQVIDEIELQNFEPGEYILMIKEKDNRALFKSFKLD